MAIVGRVPVLLALVVAGGFGVGFLAVELADRSGLIRALSGRVPVDSPAGQAARLKNERAASALLAAGETRKAANDLKGALEAFAAALKLQPGDADILSRMAQVRMALGDHRGAAADLDLAIKARPRDAALLFARGNARALIGMPREALGDLSGAIAALPGQAPFHVARASVLETLGRKAEAQEDRKRASQFK